MFKFLVSLTVAAALGAALAIAGCQSGETTSATTLPSSNNTFYASASAVAAAENVTMALLGAHKITPAQAQGVADQCKAIRSAIAAADAASAPTGSNAADSINRAVASLQAYVTEISR